MPTSFARKELPVRPCDVAVCSPFGSTCLARQRVVLKALLFSEAMGLDPCLVSAPPDDFVCSVCHQLVDVSASYTKCTHGT